MPRTAMSLSVIMPMRRSPSVTGMDPASALSMKFAACCTGWSGRTVWTSRVITSLTFMVALLLNRAEERSARSASCSLWLVFGQEVIGRDQLVILVEDLDRPPHLSRLFRLDRLCTDSQLHPDRIARIDGRQEPQVFKAGVGQDGPWIGINEQSGGKAQQEIAVGNTSLEDRRSLCRFLVHVGVE